LIVSRSTSTCGMVGPSWLSGGFVELRHHHCRRSTT
jgi:hypothetical protein